MDALRQLADFRLQLDKLLDRIERSTTHYDVLGLDQAATYEQIVRAYYGAVSILYPAYQFRASIPEEALDRMDRAFSKISWAFSTLADFKKRADYHSLVLSKAKGAAPAPKPQAASGPGATLRAVKEARRATGSRPAYSGADSSRNATPEAPLTSPEPARQLQLTQSAQQTVYSEFKSQSKDDNRRRSQRFKLTLPARLSGCDRTGTKWKEMTQTLDVSRTGVTLQVRQRLRAGMVVYLTIPLPTKLRSHGFADASFNTYALVRRVEPPRKGERVVALEFIGEHPPAGYLEKPWTTFKPSQWAGNERRRSGRQNRVEKIRVEYYNDAFQSLGIEDTESENISKQGMRFRVARAPFEFDLVRIQCPALKFHCLAVVRNRYVNKDQIERLCVQFVNPANRPAS